MHIARDVESRTRDRGGRERELAEQLHSYPLMCVDEGCNERTLSHTLIQAVIVQARARWCNSKIVVVVVVVVLRKKKRGRGDRRAAFIVLERGCLALQGSERRRSLRKNS
jgi:hypothetical protein